MEIQWDSTSAIQRYQENPVILTVSGIRMKPVRLIGADLLLLLLLFTAIGFAPGGSSPTLVQRR
jgi:hypothetical protein